jgi:hypothetical protein
MLIACSLRGRSKLNRAATMTPVRCGIQDNFAQHSGDQAATDSTKDSKQKIGNRICAMWHVYAH